MTKARPKEGPSAPLFYWAPVIPILMLCTGAVQAQTVDLADLEACAALETDERKLACFEAIVADQQPVPQPAEAAPAAQPAEARSASADTTPPPAPVQATAAPAETAVVPPGPSSVSGAPAAVIVESAGAEPPPAPGPARERSAPQEPGPAPVADSPAQPASTPAATVAEAPGTAADEFGREHLGRSEDSGTETMSAVVIDVTRTGYGELVFHLDNGQVWRQQEKRYYPYPRNREFDVTISRGILGEYQLQVEGTGRKVTIRRTR